MKDALRDAPYQSPEWQAAVDAEVASRPIARRPSRPITPGELELHRQRGAADREKNTTEVARLDALIKKAELERRG